MAFLPKAISSLYTAEKPVEVRSWSWATYSVNIDYLTHDIITSENT
jgi:hypothetical protein